LPLLIFGLEGQKLVEVVQLDVDVCLIRRHWADTFFCLLFTAVGRNFLCCGFSTHL